MEMITYKAVISSDGTVDLDKTPDGRRLSAFTAMFNRSLPDIGKIYLDYKIDSKNWFTFKNLVIIIQT